MINWWGHSKNMKLFEILWWLFKGRARRGKKCGRMRPDWLSNFTGSSKIVEFQYPAYFWNLYIFQRVYFESSTLFFSMYTKKFGFFYCKHAFLTKGRWLKLNFLDMKTFMVLLDTKNCAYRSRGMWCLINFFSSILS